MSKALRRRDLRPSAPKDDLQAFRTWLLAQGLAKTTAEMYAYDVRSAAKDGFAARLLDNELAPKTRHRILAAGRQWAKFREEPTLTAALVKIKLPPARRKLAKVPVDRDQLFAILDELPRADYLSPPMCAVIGMMACRGFRVSDVLRITHEEMDQALETGVLVFLGKGHRRMEFGLSKAWSPYVTALAETVGAWTRVEDLISPGSGEKTRRKTSVRAVERALTKLAHRAAVPKVYPHRLRRTYAVEYLRQHPGDPEALLKLTQHMQWADESTALQYVNHARGRELDAAAERIFER